MARECLTSSAPETFVFGCRVCGAVRARWHRSATVQCYHALRPCSCGWVQHHCVGHPSTAGWRHLSRGALLCPQGRRDPHLLGWRRPGRCSHGLGHCYLSQGTKFFPFFIFFFLDIFIDTYYSSYELICNKLKWNKNSRIYRCSGISYRLPFIIEFKMPLVTLPNVCRHHPAPILFQCHSCKPYLSQSSLVVCD